MKCMCIPLVKNMYIHCLDEVYVRCPDEVCILCLNEMYVRYLGEMYVRCHDEVYMRCLVEIYILSQNNSALVLVQNKIVQAHKVTHINYLKQDLKSQLPKSPWCS